VKDYLEKLEIKFDRGDKIDLFILTFLSLHEAEDLKEKLLNNFQVKNLID
jgi:hypothetical protein